MFYSSFSSQKEDEIEEYLRNKYANESDAVHRFGDGGEEMSDEITQQTLLPGVKDPNLWMVKCRIGEEKATVLLLMRKFLTYQFSGKYCLVHNCKTNWTHARIIFQLIQSVPQASRCK